MKSKKNGRTVPATIGCRRSKVRTAARSAWNPHKYLVAAARRVWRWDPDKKAASEVCAVGTTQRRCASCAQVFPKKLVHMDHIIPVGKQPREWEEYPAFYRRLFCPASNIQGLCRPCHRIKTRKDLKDMHS